MTGLKTDITEIPVSIAPVTSTVHGCSGAPGKKKSLLYRATAAASTALVDVDVIEKDAGSTVRHDECGDRFCTDVGIGQRENTGAATATAS